MTSDRIEEIRQSPDQLDDLSGREFEELVGEILASFRWRVNLTPVSRDGGYDILGISPDPTGLDTSWIVECKRYSSDRPVTVEIMRGLYGVKEGLRIPQAVLVTTSRLTREAERFVASVSGLHIVDRARLLKWLASYQRQPTGILHIATHRFQSCFISYASKDEEFAARLHGDLQDHGVLCWFAPHHIEAGKKLYEQINEAIKRFDRLLLILSEHSMNSEWVKTEIAQARRKETDQKRQVLFPVALSPFSVIREWTCFDADTGKDSAREIREYFIPDFSNWQDKASYERALQRLVRDLMARTAGTA